MRDASESRDIAVGDCLRDRYVLLERLGCGAVYKALDRYRSTLPEAQRCVALKILLSRGGCSEQVIADLRRELHPAQSLSHRNIVNVYELDRDGDVVFFTMELLQGECLSSVIERMRPAGMRAVQAWQLVRQLGAGLEHAHERGVVHGNLSPRNVFITREGELRILNFGETASLSAAYASCEQLEGRPAEAADDLYALACITVELLTGNHPFESRPATLARDFGVRPVRPAGSSSRQWRALQRGLSWHRGGRSLSVGAWMRQLTHQDLRHPKITPLHEVASAGAARRRLSTRSGLAIIAALLITALCVPQLWSSSTYKVADASLPSVPPAGAPAKRGSIAPSAQPAIAPTADSGAPGPKRPAILVPAATTKAGPAAVTVDSTPVRSGDRFVEVRVRRSTLRKTGTFTWWTETATAKQGVDFEPQTKAIQTFPAGGLSTRFYVKLMPDSVRTERGYFYIAVAQPGHVNSAAKVTRLQIWLPRSREQLQARR